MFQTFKFKNQLIAELAWLRGVYELQNTIIWWFFSIFKRGELYSNDLSFSLIQTYRRPRTDNFELKKYLLCLAWFCYFGYTTSRLHLDLLLFLIKVFFLSTASENKTQALIYVTLKSYSYCYCYCYAIKLSSYLQELWSIYSYYFIYTQIFLFNYLLLFYCN